MFLQCKRVVSYDIVGKEKNLRPTFYNISLLNIDNNFVHLRISEKSSTKIISCMRCSGDLSNTECTVLSSTDQASLWKQIITAVGGRSFKYLPGSLHLKQKKIFL